MQHATDAADEAEAADCRKLMNGHGPRNRSVIVDVDMSAQQRTVGDNHMIADIAVVSDMGAGHQETVVTDGSDSAILFGTSIDGDTFTNDVVVANLDFGGSALVGDILWFAADYGIGVDVISSPRWSSCP